MRRYTLLGFLALVGCATVHTARPAEWRWVVEPFVLSPTPFEAGAGSGARIKGGPFAGPPIQGFSALTLDVDGGLLTVSDNGYGGIHDSADFRPGVFALTPRDGGLEVALRFHFTGLDGGTLTGSDFDPESLVRVADGTFWVGEEFGPSLVHFDAQGHQLAPAMRVTNVRGIDAPENTALIRFIIPSGVRTVSPSHELLTSRAQVDQLHWGGFTVVPWTVNDPARMRELIDFGVDGLITDRPDLALALDAGIDIEGHRGARGLQPENTLPAFEAAVDLGTPTLELDLTEQSDGGVVIWHDPTFTAQKCRGTPVICDVLQRERFPDQRNVPGPKSVAWSKAHRHHPYAPVRLPELLAFLDSIHATPRLNLETKGTSDEAVLRVRQHALRVLSGTPWERRATLQSFNPASLQPAPIPTIALVEGLPIPQPFTVSRSAGFENLALTTDQHTLFAMLEKPEVGAPHELRAFAFDLTTQTFTGEAFRVALDPRAIGMADLTMINRSEALALERDDKEGVPDAYKRIIHLTLPKTPGGLAERRELVDLMQLHTRDGTPFTFPFWTVEGIHQLADGRIVVVADNNFPFGRARHPGSEIPDDSELIILTREPK